MLGPVLREVPVTETGAPARSLGVSHGDGRRRCLAPMAEQNSWRCGTWVGAAQSAWRGREGSDSSPSAPRPGQARVRLCARRPQTWLRAPGRPRPPPPCARVPAGSASLAPRRGAAARDRRAATGWLGAGSLAHRPGAPLARRHARLAAHHQAAARTAPDSAARRRGRLAGGRFLPAPRGLRARRGALPFSPGSGSRSRFLPSRFFLPRPRPLLRDSDMPLGSPVVGRPRGAGGRAGLSSPPPRCAPAAGRPSARARRLL